MKIKTYIINLKRSEDRRKKMEEMLSEFDQLDYSFIKAVDGQNLSENELDDLFDRAEFMRVYGRLPRVGEIGCTLSHRKAYEIFLKSNEEYCLILEDDVVVNPDIDKITEHLNEFVPSSLPWVLLFTPWFSYFPKSLFSCKEYKVHNVNYASNAMAYMINRKAAELMISENVPYIVADDWWHYKKKGVTLLGVVPSLVSFGSLSESTLINIRPSVRIDVKDRKRSFSEVYLFKQINSYGTLVIHKLLKTFGFYNRF